MQGWGSGKGGRRGAEGGGGRTGERTGGADKGRGQGERTGGAAGSIWESKAGKEGWLEARYTCAAGAGFGEL
jgi:hypothetical protein